MSFTGPRMPYMEPTPTVSKKEREFNEYNYDCHDKCDLCGVRRTVSRETNNCFSCTNKKWD